MGTITGFAWRFLCWEALDRRGAVLAHLWSQVNPLGENYCDLRGGPRRIYIF
jgi:hypothetical protein